MRMFVSVASALHIAFGCGMRFSAVDACFSKHSMYRQGYLHLLTTRDGNNRVLPLAWAWCETESGDTYNWFAQQCYEAGLGRYLNKNSVVFSDRMKGVNEFFGWFEAYHGHCFQHIIGNAKAHCRGTGTTFADELAWNMRHAHTKHAFDVHLAAIRVSSPAAAHYFETQVEHERAYQYALNDKHVATHGFKTSQIVECTNGVFVEARQHTPYRANNMILSWMGKQYDERLLEITKWLDKSHLLTPYAHREFSIQVWPLRVCVLVWAHRNMFGPLRVFVLIWAHRNMFGPLLVFVLVWAHRNIVLQKEIAKRTGHAVTAGGTADIFYVQRVDTPDATAYEVDFSNGLASVKCCEYVSINNLPCRHCVPVFYKRGLLSSRRKAESTISRFWPKWARASVYHDMYSKKSVRQPQIFCGEFTGPDEHRRLPPRQDHKRGGRPRKERYRSKPKSTKAVKVRLPVVYHGQYQEVMTFL